MKNLIHAPSPFRRVAAAASALALAALGTSSFGCFAEDAANRGDAEGLSSASGTSESEGEPGSDQPALTAVHGTLPAPEEPPRSADGIDPEVNVGDVDGDPLVEGDILVAPGAAGVAGSARTSKPWPGGVVAYAIDPKLPDPKRVTAAMAHWEARTGIRFVARKTEAAYVVFVPGSGCSSYIGRIGSAQKINLAANCGTGTVIHEIGHAVGLWHEQSRSDRDSFVKILLANVSKGFEGNFSKTTFASPGKYDLGSIMHYGSTYFSANGKPTMTRLNGSLIVPNRAALSSGDLAGISSIYAGEKTPAPAPSAALATTTDALNLRSGPGTTFAALLVMPAGATVRRTGKSENGFDAVTYAGRSGWAYAAYLTP